MEGPVARRPLHWRIVCAEWMLSSFSSAFSLIFFSSCNANQTSEWWTHTHACTHTSSQHSLCGNQHSNMSNWIFFSPPPLSIVSNTGSGVYGCVCMTLFKRVYFSQYHLFSLPLTQLYCIKKTEHNICCQLMYAVMDINGSAAESFTSQKVKRGERGGLHFLCCICKKK